MPQMDPGLKENICRHIMMTSIVFCPRNGSRNWDPLQEGEWQPNPGKVLVTKEVGKFWSHFGHMEDGKKMLHPEEAMFLLDEGQMEVYYGGMPLSVQEAFATLLGHTVPLDNYQVFAHLARLGYTLRRHEPITVVTEYERKIHLDKHQKKKSKKQRKRPTNATSKETSGTKYDTEKEDVSTVKRHKMEELSKNCAKQDDNECLELRLDGNAVDGGATVRVERQTDGPSGGSTWCTMNTSNAAAPITDNSVGMCLTNCITGNVTNISQSTSAASIRHIPYSNWDFSTIVFPDIPRGKSSLQLRLPALELLPDDIRCKDAHVEHHKVSYISRQPLDSGSEISLRHSLEGRAQNWGEYKEGLARLSPDNRLLLCTPAPSLWKGDVTPLVKPYQATSTDAVFEKLNLIQNIDVTKIDVKKHTDSISPKIVYDVFLPDSKFKKSNPGQPDHRIFVVRQDDPPPTLLQIQQLSCQSCDEVPLNWAVVDNGDIAFYSFNLVDLPRDISFV